MNAPKQPSPEKRQREPGAKREDDLGPDRQKSKDEQGNNFTETAKPAFNPLTLIKEDLNQIKEGVKKIFKDKDSDPKPSQSAEKNIGPLTNIKEDFNSFKKELSNIFKIGPLRNEENKNVEEKEESRNNPGINASRHERDDEPFKSLFRREKPPLNKTQTNQMQVATICKADLENNPSKENKEQENKTSKSPKNGLNESENSLLTRSEKTLAPQPSEMTFTSKTATARERSNSKHILDGSPTVDDEDKDKPLETVLSSEISLIPLRTNPSNEPTEDFWSLKNSAIYLTFDPNTANSELRLANGNRKATRDWLKNRSVDHPERFKHCPQVLCREALLDLAYWEVLWSCGADIGLTYNNISRDGDTASCLLGHNEQSWSLECSNGFYTPCHNNRRLRSSSPEPFTNRVGIYLDCYAGTLSFFCVSQDAMVHLHTFTSTFTEPLYPCFWVWDNNGSVTLCQVELNWERLLK